MALLRYSMLSIIFCQRPTGGVLVINTMIPPAAGESRRFDVPVVRVKGGNFPKLGSDQLSSAI